MNIKLLLLTACFGVYAADGSLTQMATGQAVAGEHMYFLAEALQRCRTWCYNLRPGLFHSDIAAEGRKKVFCVSVQSLLNDRVKIELHCKKKSLVVVAMVPSGANLALSKRWFEDAIFLLDGAITD